MSALPPLPRLRVLHLLAWAAIYFCAGSYLLQFPRYIQTIGGAPQDAGWLLALGLIPALTIGTWAGEWNRRSGGRWPGTLGGTLVVLSTLAMLTMQELGVWMVAIRMLYAVGHSLVFISLFAQAAFLLEHPVQRAKLIGWLAIAVQLGNAAGGTLGELAYLRGMTNYWLESAGLALVALALAFCWRVAPSLPDNMPSAAPSTSPAMQWPSEVWGIAAVGMAFAGLAQFLPSFIEYQGSHDHLATPFIAAWFITPALLVVAGVRLFAGFFAARLMHPWVLGLCHALLLLTLICVPWLHTREQALGLGMLFGLGYGWLYPALSAQAFNHSPPEARGKVAGWIVAAFEVGFRLSPIGLGYTISYFGYATMFWSLVVAYLCLILIGQLRRNPLNTRKELPCES